MNLQRLFFSAVGVTALITIPLKAGQLAISGSLDDPCIRVLEEAISRPLVDGKMWGGKTPYDFFRTTLACLESTPVGIVTVPVRNLMDEWSNLFSPNLQEGQLGQ